MKKARWVNLSWTWPKRNCRRLVRRDSSVWAWSKPRNAGSCKRWSKNHSHSIRVGTRRCTWSTRRWKAQSRLRSIPNLLPGWHSNTAPASPVVLCSWLTLMRQRNLFPGPASWWNTETAVLPPCCSAPRCAICETAGWPAPVPEPGRARQLLAFVSEIRQSILAHRAAPGYVANFAHWTRQTTLKFSKQRKSLRKLADGAQWSIAVDRGLALRRGSTESRPTNGFSPKFHW